MILGLKKTALFLPAFLLFAWRPCLLSAETLTLTTYYPAPYGGYVNLLTTGRSVFARDDDYVTVGKAGDIADKLIVNGNLKVINDISGGNVLAGGKPVVTSIVCDYPLLCTITNNTLRIAIGLAECSAPAAASGSASFGVEPDGRICKVTSNRARYKCPVKPSVPDSDCPLVRPGVSTCYGQEQSDPTCKWFKVNSGDVVIGTEEYTCSVSQYVENCKAVK